MAGRNLAANKILEVAQATGAHGAAFQNRRYVTQRFSHPASYLQQLDLGRVVHVKYRYGSFRLSVEIGWCGFHQCKADSLCVLEFIDQATHSSQEKEEEDHPRLG